MSKATLQAINPVLPSKDVAAAVAYYTERLGFEKVFQDDPNTPRYAAVKRDGVELHLQWHDPVEWAAVERPMLRFEVPQIEALFEEYQTQSVFHERTALRDTPWGTKEFAFYDLDHNGLTFYRDLP